MRVVFLEDVEGVALGGEVKNVKSGFARNYLIPRQLATIATSSSLQRVEKLKKHAEDTRLKNLTDMKSLAEELEGVEVNVPMRAGASGRLYGSVTNVVIGEELGKLTDREIDRRKIDMPESIRQVGIYQVRIRLHSDVSANIKLLVYPEGTEPSDFVPPEVIEEETQNEPTFEQVIEEELASSDESVSGSTENIEEYNTGSTEPNTDPEETVDVNPVKDEQGTDEALTGGKVPQD